MTDLELLEEDLAIPPAGKASGGGPPRRSPLRPLLVLFGLVVSSVVAFYIGSTRTESPAEQAARSAAPALSTLSAPVERRSLQAKLVTRGTVTAAFETEVDCIPSASGVNVAATTVFTRSPIELGSRVREGDVLAEINGRPVVLLVGSVPAYRDLLPGASGDDVKSLQTALGRLGFDPGDGGVLDSRTQDAVAAWYRSLGYEPDGPSEAEMAALAAARTAVRQAETALIDSESALAAAKQGPDRVEFLQADIAVAQALSQLNEARASGGPTGALELQLQLAEANRQALYVRPDTSREERQVADASEGLGEAKARLAELDRATGIGVPFCEVLFIPQLPGVMTTVAEQDGASPGQRTGAPWARIASGKLALQATISAQDRSLVAEGIGVTFGGEARLGQLRSIGTTAAADDGRVAISIQPDQELEVDWLGQNLRVDIPVEATGDEVLVVPLAALYAAPDGSAQVTRLTGDEKVVVEVHAGLAADGYVEVEPIEGALLDAGDLVVVGG